MVPFGSIAEVKEVTGPGARESLQHVSFRADQLQRRLRRELRSGDRKHAGSGQQELGWSMRYEWTELALLQLQTGNTAMLVLLLAVVLVFLVLAAQYESWSLPLAVILVVPMCLLCSVVAVQWADMDVNIFTQVGFVVLIGLACKNAILVVEFARAKPADGQEPLSKPRSAACQLAAAADRDDLVRVHPGRGAAGAFGGRRRGNAPHAGHRRVWRHAGRDAVWHFSDARVLLRD